ncbi:MAG: ATP-binding cassette domain-containing protein, partial [Candidatus Eisenbacteria bacterium]|nr:ATP-binding cassette domain-containing protein [Candidatus Eisenbacteria bacterium]
MEHRSILQVQDVVLGFGDKRVLDHLSLDFWAGHVHAVVGPNGAGKSTLASAVMGLSGYTKYEGDILLDGESLKGLAVDERAGRGITLAWQEPARFEGLSVERFVSAGAKDSSPERVADALEAVELDPARYRDRRVDQTLSGGERKRIELASILAMEPRVVMMDEPDSGIDVVALDRIFEALGRFRETGATVLLITHSPVVLEHADHAFLMCCGRLIEKGSVDEISRYFGEKCIPCDHKNRPEGAGGGG